MNDCTFIIFGASGDLAKKKLFPALYQLIARKKIEKFAIIGASIDETTADAILDKAQPYMVTLDQALYATLRANTYYKKVDFLRSDDFTALAAYVADIEKKHHLSGRRMIYLAAASNYYCSITRHAAESGLAKKKLRTDEIWHRLVYEKPFGHDAASAHEINECIASFFDETQIYRIDHYLTKELVGNIALVRFTNCVFEPLWNNRYIDQVQIILSEHVGIEGRGVYYDAYGALSDVVQNHMLELLALIGMESPEWLTGDHIRNERAKVLEKVVVVDALLGQYAGYTHEKMVRSDSTTETFAVVALMINNARWAGVPFYLKTGKCLDKKETSIHIKFKQVDCLLTKHCPTDSNYLTITVSPEASFSLTLNAKKPGVSDQVTPINMEFCHSCVFGTVTPQAHEVIFEEIIRGDQSIAVRFDEIESAWRVIDAIKKMDVPLYTYPKNSRGPVEVQEFSRKHGIRWRS